MNYQFKCTRTIQDEVMGEVDEEQEYELPGKMAVCSTCGGRGRQVNPAIDGHGLTREDFDEDPDFEEAYYRGDYDVQCPECRGQNVTLVIDWERLLVPGTEHDDSPKANPPWEEAFEAYKDYEDDRRAEAADRREARETRRAEQGYYDG